MATGYRYAGMVDYFGKIRECVASALYSQLYFLWRVDGIIHRIVYQGEESQKDD